jgi:flagellar biosynthesis/type III secretory pathway protein FliH
MTRLVLARAGGLALELEEPVISADALPAVGDAIDTLRRLESLREDLIRGSRSRFESAREAGFAQGRDDATREFEGRIAAALERIESALRAERIAREARVVELALAVIDRIAGELGDVTVVAAMARHALAGLDPERPVVLRVHPAVAAALPAPAAGQPGPRVLKVLPDPALEPFDCEIDAEDCIVEAGLAVQLGAMRRALARPLPEDAP